MKIMGAFELLDSLYGTYKRSSTLKKNYDLPTHIISNPDVTRIINSDEIQSVCRVAGTKHQKRSIAQKKNPLRNTGVMLRLNPYSKVVKRAEILGKNKRSKDVKKIHNPTSKKFLETLNTE
ncbi:60S ribosomal protein L4B [Basidiobolus ranarum]|uniref:60S ribosomal protein L4B n=1 Tax=Basidiobolus ranarum TaxID=34480 RepID=A0ABR2VLF7_9FUNG